MKSWLSRFNIYLLAGLLAATAGCQTGGQDKDDKKVSTLRLQLEVNADGSGRNGPVKILRNDPVIINVENAPFLTEVDVEKAEVIDEPGSSAIKVQFKAPDGVRLLEMVTTANKGKRIAVFSQFGDARWLAAPLISQSITNGVFIFTPDANREETERIVLGLNNVAKEIKKKYGY
ncbi:MAG: hypothetical protein M1608_15430 [Candidatus Omnitrophica bacterium]|nr:hypothetical protein [Candidatus Omnitrophota bacterium]